MRKTRLGTQRCCPRASRNNKNDGAWHIGDYIGVVEDQVERTRVSARKQQRRNVSTIEAAADAKQHSDDMLKKAAAHIAQSMATEVLRPAKTELLDELVAGEATHGLGVRCRGSNMKGSP